MKHNFEHFCKEPENIENYDKAAADNFKGWECHHRKGVDIPREKLKALGMYWHRPASELIFLKHSEHRFLHHKGKQFSEEHKKKLSEAHKGNKNVRGKHWYNNGKENRFCFECPEGFTPGQLKRK